MILASAPDMLCVRFVLLTALALDCPLPMLLPRFDTWLSTVARRAPKSATSARPTKWHA